MDRIRSGYSAATADLSTALRSGRDDKEEGGYFPEQWRIGWTELGVATPQQPQISPLRFAPVGMTKGRAVIFRNSGESDGQD
jgi:hypothetical protein